MRALLALPGTGWSTRLRGSSLEIVTGGDRELWLDREAAFARRSPRPPASRRMDEAMAWIMLIPVDRYVLRRIVGARSLVHPITERHLTRGAVSRPRIGADHKAMQRWHAQGIDLIVRARR